MTRVLEYGSYRRDGPPNICPEELSGEYIQEKSIRLAGCIARLAAERDEVWYTDVWRRGCRHSAGEIHAPASLLYVRRQSSSEWVAQRAKPDRGISCTPATHKQGSRLSYVLMRFNQWQSRYVMLYAVTVRITRNSDVGEKPRVPQQHTENGHDWNSPKSRPIKKMS